MKRLILSITLALLALFFANTWAKNQVSITMSDDELNQIIDSLVNIEQPLTAAPYIAEARQRATATKNTPWMLSLIYKDIHLNARRLSKQTDINSLIEKEALAAWSPLRQQLYLNLYLLNGADSTLRLAFDDPTALRALPSNADTATCNKAPYENINLLDNMLVALAVNDNHIPSLHSEQEISILTAPLPDFAASTISLPAKYDILRSASHLALENNDELSIVLMQAVRSYIFRSDRSLFQHIDNLKNEIVNSKAENPTAQNILLLAKANYDVQLARNNFNNKPLADSLISQALADFKTASNGLKNTIFSSAIAEIVEEIEKSEASITSDVQIAPAKTIPLFVQYRNVSTLYTVVYQLPKDFSYYPSLDSLKLYKRISEKKISLPEIRTRIVNSSAYTELDAVRNPGRYLIVAYANKQVVGTPCNDAPLAACSFLASDIAVAKIEEAGDNKMLFSDFTSGQPLKGVKVQDHGSSDADGLISLGAKRNSSDLNISLNNDSWDVSASNFRTVGNNVYDPDKKSLKAQIVTDRNIYRPGQSVQFKVYAFYAFQNRMESVPKDEKFKVAIKTNDDDNDVSIDLTTNDFGTLSGSLSIPSNAIKGAASISVFDANNRCLVTGSFNIEDYKLSDNKISFDPVEEILLPGSTINISGSASTAAGLPLANQKISYVISNRNVRNYDFAENTDDSNSDISVADIYGSVTTDNDGHFAFSFISKPSSAQANEDFQQNEEETYSVCVRLTDSRGESLKASTSYTVSTDGATFSARANRQDDDKNPTDLSLNLSSFNDNNSPYATTFHIALYPYDPTYQLPQARYDDIDSLLISAPRMSFPSRRKKGNVVYETDLPVCGNTSLNISALGLENGAYYAEISTLAPSGTLKRKTLNLDLDSGIDSSEDLGRISLICNNSCSAGESLPIRISSKLSNAHITLFVACRNKIVLRKTVELSNNEEVVLFDVHNDAFEDEKIYIKTLLQYDGRTYTVSRTVTVQRSTPPLKMALSSFRDFSTPAAHESWSLKVDSGADVEVVASMYDARLDDYVSNAWHYRFSRLYITNYFSLSSIRPRLKSISATDENTNTSFHPSREPIAIDWLLDNSVRALDECGGVPTDLGTDFHRMYKPLYLKSARARVAGIESISDDNSIVETESVAMESYEAQEADAENVTTSTTLSDVDVRTNFAETAFFLPHLRPDANGYVSFSFDLPDNLTSYNFRALAHDRQMQTSQVLHSLTVRKALNVRIGTPRFVTEGDTITISADVTTISKDLPNGEASISVTDAESGRALVSLPTQKLDFSSSVSQQVKWSLTIPEGLDTIKIAVRAAAGDESDGEQYNISVAKRYVEVPESHTFTLFEKGSSTLINPFSDGRTVDVTFSYTSNTFIEVLRALPFLDEGRSPSSDTYVSRFETCAIASYLKKKSEIKKAIEYLEKNKNDLSTLSDADDTPWLYMANRLRKHDADLLRLMSGSYAEDNMNDALHKLLQMQNSDGSFPWFKGMDGSSYITASVISTIADLISLGIVDAENDDINAIFKNALPYLDAQIAQCKKVYEERKAKSKDATPAIGYEASSLIRARALINAQATDDIKYLVDVWKKTWNKSSALYAKSDMASRILAANTFMRLGERQAAETIIKSVEENLVQKDDYTAMVVENGLFRSYQEFEAQGLLIMSLRQINPNSENINKLVNQLIIQKRGEAWPDRQITSRAVLALLSASSSLEASDKVSIDGKTYKTSVSQPKLSIPTQAKEVTIVKKNNVPSWGAWQRTLLTPSDSLAADTTSALSISRSVKVLRNEDGVSKWVSAENNELKVGDQLRITLRFYNSENLSFVRIRDNRSATFEPLDKLSGYRGWWFWYRQQSEIKTPMHYLMISDETTEFFIDHLSDGWHELTYDVYVTHEGSFTGGYAEATCLYDNTITAHTSGNRLTVK